MPLLPARLPPALLVPAVLAVLAAAAGGSDLGVPRDGFDRVLLDDGRVLDAGALLEAARFLAALPGGAARAREVLEAAIAADPLHGDARCALAALLPPGEAEPMRALGEALGGRPPAAEAAPAVAPPGPSR